MLTVNVDEALSRLDGDHEIYNELITAFLQDSGSDLNNLREAVSAMNPEKTAYYAHKIKGAALTLGAERLSHRAEILEQAARKSEERNYETIFGDMETEYHTAVEQLTALRQDQ